MGRLRRRPARKKLTEAARRWAGGIEPDRDHAAEVRETAAELKQLGVPLEVMEPWAEEDPIPEEVDLVLPEDCRTAVLSFTRAATQWRYVTPGLGRPIPLGLDYAKLEASIRMSGVACTPQLFDDIRRMEKAALPLM